MLKILKPRNEEAEEDPYRPFVVRARRQPKLQLVMEITSIRLASNQGNSYTRTQASGARDLGTPDHHRFGIRASTSLQGPSSSRNPLKGSLIQWRLRFQERLPHPSQ